MNEHIWKKLGEVKAFSIAADDFLTRGEEGFVAGDILSAVEIDQLKEAVSKHVQRIDKIAADEDANDVVDTKTEATGEKLTDMQNRYLVNDNDWKDPMELLEWSGFFFGGAVIHWNLIRGASESIHNPDLTALSEGGFKFYSQLMETATESIHQLAKEETQN
jgi:hypothetical protein